MAAPPPAAAWSLDGTGRGNAVSMALHGDCNYTMAHDGHRQALIVGEGGCYASAASTSSVQLGGSTSSLSACTRFRMDPRGGGGALLSKLARARGASRGFAIEVADSGIGLGVSLADSIGVSAHEEVGRTMLADGAWHHACVVLQRVPSPQLLVYVDGLLSENLLLGDSRLSRLGSIDSDAPLLLGRRTADEPAGGFRGAMCEVALWSRALLPEHVATLHRHGLPLPRARRGRQRAGGRWRAAAQVASGLRLSARSDGHRATLSRYGPAVALLLAVLLLMGLILGRRWRRRLTCSCWR